MDNYKTTVNYQITPLTVQSRLQPNRVITPVIMTKLYATKFLEFHQRKFLLICLIKAVNLSKIDLVKFLKKPAINLPNVTYLFIK